MQLCKNAVESFHDTQGKRFWCNIEVFISRKNKIARKIPYIHQRNTMHKVRFFHWVFCEHQDNHKAKFHSTTKWWNRCIQKTSSPPLPMHLRTSYKSKVRKRELQNYLNLSFSSLPPLPIFILFLHSLHFRRLLSLSALESNKTSLKPVWGSSVGILAGHANFLSFLPSHSLSSFLCLAAAECDSGLIKEMDAHTKLFSLLCLPLSSPFLHPSSRTTWAVLGKGRILCPPNSSQLLAISSEFPFPCFWAASISHPPISTFFSFLLPVFLYKAGKTRAHNFIIRFVSLFSLSFHQLLLFFQNARRTGRKTQKRKGGGRRIFFYKKNWAGPQKTWTWREKVFFLFFWALQPKERRVADNDAWGELMENFKKVPLF